MRARLCHITLFFSDRKFAASNLEQLRKKASEIGFTRRGSLERKSGSDKRSSWSSDELSTNYDTFRPITLTISNFFKQVFTNINVLMTFRFRYYRACKITFENNCYRCNVCVKSIFWWFFFVNSKISQDVVIIMLK